MKPPLPPPTHPVRCQFKFKPNYQCAENATWYAPSIDESGKFKWILFCTVHKEDFILSTTKLFKSFGIKPDFKEIGKIV